MTTTRTALLRAPGFRLLFAGQAVSVVGDRLVMVAMPFAVLTVPGAGLGDVGLVLGSSALTLGLFVLVGGVWADRLPRHLTMLGSDVVRGAAQAVAATLLLTGTASVASLVACNLVYGAAEAFFRPALLGLVPQVVDPDQRQAANALLSLASNSAMVLGPVVAGLLVAVTGPGTALGVDACSFGVSAVTLAFLRPRLVVRETAPASFLAELAGGWREVRSRTWVWSTILFFCAYCGLVLPGVFVLGPSYAQAHRGGAGAWGVISAGFGVGAVLGSLLALRWRPSRPGAVLAGALSLGGLQAAILVTPLPTAVVALLEAGTGVGVALAFSLWDTLLQERVPPEAQSRVSSFDFLGSLTLMPLGLVVVGPVAERFGDVRTGVGATVLTVSVGVAVALSRDVRGMRRTDVVPQQATEPAAVPSPLPA
ncbi:MAG: putative major facilitator superfamily transporter [Frankiales bacterium]|nr:putative major facilitator superfamily transporter [Frankiales bacterium]